MSIVKVSRDRAVNWKFSQLDLNRDQILDRQEWKPYKTVLLEWKNVKHCTRNLFKTCDINFDKKLAKEEWKACIIPECLLLFIYFMKSLRCA
uniref:SPARC_Ca_bdg domain-containing protein n=1 Tax=Heterorhabditis bacteriophora TaxID=37862 RepID=A0A1I7X815_HETBA